MNRKLKLVTVLMSIVLCFSVCTFTAMAVDADLDGFDDETGEVIQTDPFAEPVTDSPPYVEPTQDVPVTDAPYVEPTQSVDYGNDDYDDNNDYNYDDDYNNSDDYDDSYDDSQNDNNLYAGGEVYTDPISTAPSADLYDSNHIIDENELSNKDWKDISARLKNAGESDTDSDDFSFIKNNDSLGDNGEWLLICGIFCLLLGIAGIVYLIMSAVKRRKILNYGGKPAMASSGAGDYRRASDDYNDGFKTPNRSERKIIERSRKFDTAEIPVQIPKGTRYKSNGGKRYR